MRGLRSLILALIVVLALTVTGCGLLPGGDDSGDDTGTTSGSDIVKVTLSWGESVDMDLEIWESQGDEALFAASQYASEDIFSGADGDEFFEFRVYEDEDYSVGEYVISVYFAEEEDVVDDVRVTLEVRKSDGSTITRTGTVYWEPGRDQWHAFRIDAATGDIEDIDELIEIEVTE